MSTSSSTPLAFEFLEKLAALESTILDRHPSLPTLLREIHTALRKQPENVTLLPEDQIQIIVRGLEVQTNTFLAESVSKTAKKPGSVASLKSKGADAF